MVPFSGLTELTPHENQLWGRMGVHVSKQQAEVGKFPPLIAGHSSQQRSFAVNHLIMRKGEHKIFRECIHDTKGDLILVVLAMDGIFLKERKRIMHPPHHPLFAESKSSQAGGF